MKNPADDQRRTAHAAPYINVTPLIDVLLVLLIIFMVITPLRPSHFKALVPEAPRDEVALVAANPWTLVVNVSRTHQLSLNGSDDLGTVEDAGALASRLTGIFSTRAHNLSSANASEIASAGMSPRTVFIKAPRSLSYGAVARVLDAVKGAGAAPVGLQIDELDE